MYIPNIYIVEIWNSIRTQFYLNGTKEHAVKAISNSYFSVSSYPPSWCAW